MENNLDRLLSIPDGGQLTEEDLHILLDALHAYQRAEIQYAIDVKVPKEQFQEVIDDIQSKCQKIRYKLNRFIDIMDLPENREWDDQWKK